MNPSCFWSETAVGEKAERVFFPTVLFIYLFILIFVLQMHDIVKAVGNCSYNQLVEKIISCKQSDNSELAGEGER